MTQTSNGSRWASSLTEALGLPEPVSHEAIVPTAGGVPPWCSCGWQQPSRRGPYLADHLREVRAQ